MSLPARGPRSASLSSAPHPSGGLRAPPRAWITRVLLLLRLAPPLETGQHSHDIWLSSSRYSRNYGECSFLQRQNSTVNENLGFGVKPSSVQGDFGENDSPCFGFPRGQMGRNGLKTNLGDWPSMVGALRLWMWMVIPGWLSLWPGPSSPECRPQAGLAPRTRPGASQHPAQVRNSAPLLRGTFSRCRPRQRWDSKLPFFTLRTENNTLPQERSGPRCQSQPNPRVSSLQLF